MHVIFSKVEIQLLSECVLKSICIWINLVWKILFMFRCIYLNTFDWNLIIYWMFKSYRSVNIVYEKLHCASLFRGGGGGEAYYSRYEKNFWFTCSHPRDRPFSWHSLVTIWSRYVRKSSKFTHQATILF